MPWVISSLAQATRLWQHVILTGALQTLSRPLTCGPRRLAAARPIFSRASASGLPAASGEGPAARRPLAARCRGGLHRGTYLTHPTRLTPTLSGAGGFLQTAYFGYTQLRINDTALTLDPQLPELATQLALRGIAYRGARINVRYDARALSVEVQAAPAGVAAFDRALVQNYAHACAFAASPSACSAAISAASPSGLEMSPSTQPLGLRSQRGRVVLGSGTHIVAAPPLVLIDADGASHPLSPGEPVVLPIQRVVVTSA